MLAASAARSRAARSPRRASPSAAWRPRRSAPPRRGGAARPALDRGDRRRGDGGAGRGLHADHRHARLGRLPACGARNLLRRFSLETTGRAGARRGCVGEVAEPRPCLTRGGNPRRRARAAAARQRPQARHRRGALRRRHPGAGRHAAHAISASATGACALVSIDLDAVRAAPGRGRRADRRRHPRRERRQPDHQARRPGLREDQVEFTASRSSPVVAGPATRRGARAAREGRVPRAAGSHSTSTRRAAPFRW